MMEAQLTLFEQKTTPIVRKRDPITSYKAADKQIKSGRLEFGIAQIKEWAKKYQRAYLRPDMTAKELAAYISEEGKWNYTEVYYLVQKRKSVLVERGFFEETTKERDGHLVLKLKG